MKEYRTWFFIALIVIAAVLALVGLANYIGDPSGLFRKDFSNQFLLPNEQFIKTRYIAQHGDKYDCLIFGSSRVNGIDGRNIKDAVCYNMTTAGGLPREYLGNLRYVLSKGANIKTVLVGLDEFSYSVPPGFHLSERLRYPYPPAIGEFALPYYMNYFFSLFPKDIWKKMYNGYRAKLTGEPAAFGAYDMFGTGNCFLPGIDEAIEKDPDTHAKSPRFTSVVGRQPKPETANVEAVLDDMEKIAQLARSRGVTLKVFINPAYQHRYVHVDQEVFLAFKKRLSAITEYDDFSGVNSVTTNTYYYYEGVHYRPKLGDLMIARMFHDDTVQVPADFGVHVTAGNVDEHIAAMRRQLGKR